MRLLLRSFFLTGDKDQTATNKYEEFPFQQFRVSVSSNLKKERETAKIQKKRNGALMELCIIGGIKFPLFSFSRFQETYFPRQKLLVPEVTNDRP